jgi:hypothetical protein
MNFLHMICSSVIYTLTCLTILINDYCSWQKVLYVIWNLLQILYGQILHKRCKRNGFVCQMCPYTRTASRKNTKKHHGIRAYLPHRTYLLYNFKTIKMSDRTFSFLGDDLSLFLQYIVPHEVVVSTKIHLSYYTTVIVEFKQLANSMISLPFSHNLLFNSNCILGLV